MSTGSLRLSLDLLLSRLGLPPVLTLQIGALSWTILALSAMIAGSWSPLTPGFPQPWLLTAVWVVTPV